MSAPSPLAHANNFDALRLVGALLVLIGHHFGLTGRVNPEIGAYGLYMFFVISGFLVSASWANDPNVPRFLIRRFLRLWPALAVMTATLAGVIVYLHPGSTAHKIVAELFLSNLFFTGQDVAIFAHATNKFGTLNLSLWTIPYEVAFYLALGLIAFFTGRLLKVTVLLGGAAVLLSMFLHEHWPKGLELGACFLAGVLLHHYPRVWMAAVGALLLFIHHSAGVLVLLAVATIHVGQQSWPVVRLVGRFGDLSYGTYIWACPVQQSVIALLPDIPFMASLGLAISGTLAVAFVSWHVIEKRALKLKPRGQRVGGALAGFPGNAAAVALGSKLSTSRVQPSEHVGEQ